MSDIAHVKTAVSDESDWISVSNFYVDFLSYLREIALIIIMTHVYYLSSLGEIVITCWYSSALGKTVLWWYD